MNFWIRIVCLMSVAIFIACGDGGNDDDTVKSEDTEITENENGTTEKDNDLFDDDTFNKEEKESNDEENIETDDEENIEIDPIETDITITPVEEFKTIEAVGSLFEIDVPATWQSEETDWLSEDDSMLGYVLVAASQDQFLKTPNTSGILLLFGDILALNNINVDSNEDLLLYVRNLFDPDETCHLQNQNPLQTEGYQGAIFQYGNCENTNATFITLSLSPRDGYRVAMILKGADLTTEDIEYILQSFTLNY